MALVRWSRSRATVEMRPALLDDLDEIHVLVLDGVSDFDDAALAWCLSAPCVVVACVAPGASPPTPVDLVVTEPEADDLLERIDARAIANPASVRALVDVLRVTERLDVRSGLVVESWAYSALLAGPEFQCWLTNRTTPRRRAFAGEPIEFNREGPELRIALNRPENRNAFSAEMRDSIINTIAIAEYDPAIERLVLEANGPSFCSGGDLTEFGSSSDVVRAHQIRTLRSVGAAVHRLAATTEVRMHGNCVGAGVEIPAFADRVIAHVDTTVRLPEVEMGLIPGAGGTVSITKRIGRQRTCRLALLGDAVRIDDPLVSGLVDLQT